MLEKPVGFDSNRIARALLKIMVVSLLWSLDHLDGKEILGLVKKKRRIWSLWICSARFSASLWALTNGAFKARIKIA